VQADVWFFYKAKKWVSQQQQKQPTHNETQLTIRESVEEAEKAEAAGQWDLKWAQDAEVFGPYGTAQMVQWHKEGYFKQRPVRVQP